MWYRRFNVVHFTNSLGESFDGQIEYSGDESFSSDFLVLGDESGFNGVARESTECGLRERLCCF